MSSSSSSAGSALAAAVHDVCITDWHNARDVGRAHGRFGFDEYIGHLVRWLELMGPGTRVVGVCQPCVQVPT